MGSTTPLRRALKTILYLYIEARGFVIDTSHQPQFTVFRPQVGSDLHLVEIQWGKSGRPRLVINFGRMVVGAVAPDAFHVQNCLHGFSYAARCWRRFSFYHASTHLMR